MGATPPATRTALLSLEGRSQGCSARCKRPREVARGAIELLRTIANLDDADLLRLGRWFRRYVNRWSGVPSAAGHIIDSVAYRGSKR